MRIFALGMEQKRILIVDDEHDLCDILAYNLRANGYTTTTAHSAEEALKNGVCGCDLVLLDVMMPGMSGFDLAKQLRPTHRRHRHPSYSSQPKTPKTILCTDLVSEPTTISPNHSRCAK